MRWRMLGALLLLTTFLFGFGRPPWYPRRRPEMRRNRIAQARVRPSDWPPEPASPSQVDPDRFATALEQICGWMRPGRARQYTDHILASAGEFNVDPFLIGALVYRESRCRANAENGDRGSGIGLTLIYRRMYAEQFRRGQLRYRVQVNGEWEDRSLTVDRYPFAGPRLLRAESHLYFAAALLAAWRDQAETLNTAFEQQAHRHFVSHWFWGDRVRSDRQEDRILTDRRRLLEYYGSYENPQYVIWGGQRFGCPLDGCPRVISSWIGSERDGGARSHRGVDLESLPGEPVRAVADGLVVFAGVDLPGRGTSRQVSGASGYARHPRASLGAGGRYVCLRHAREEQPAIRSCYMHMERVLVSYGDRVTAGTQLGTVGRTGMQRSAAHLHFELHTDRLEDPAEILYGLLIGRREGEPLPPRPTRR